MPLPAPQIRSRIRKHGIETPAEIEGRALITLSTSARRGLLLQADLRSSLSSRVFSMAMTAWAAKFCTSSICLSVKGRPLVDKWRLYAN